MIHSQAHPKGNGRRQRSRLFMLIAFGTLFLALSGTAFAHHRLVQTKDIAGAAVKTGKIANGAVATKKIAGGAVRTGKIANGAVTGSKIQDGTILFQNLHWTTREQLKGDTGETGAQGPTGETGAQGNQGNQGEKGEQGEQGDTGAGTPGVDGEDGADGFDGIISPHSATAGLTPLPTGPSPTVVVSLAVPAGDYLVLAKSQLSHTGAGDSVTCVLKAGSTSIDQAAMKTLPALAAIPVSLQALTSTSGELSVECVVAVANGSADFSSLIAIPVG